MEERPMNLGWQGVLTVQNIEKVVDLLRQLLSGKRYTFVAANETRRFEPEVRVSQRLKPGLKDEPISFYHDETGANRFAGFSVRDSYGVWSCSTNQQEDAPYPAEGLPYVQFDWDKVTITQRLSGGNLVFWVAAVEKETGPKFDSWDTPQFGVGHYVWIISGRNVKESKVGAINFRLLNDSGQSHVACTGYRLGISNTDSGDFLFSPDEVYATEELAKELAQWHSVSGISATEWTRAVGDRTDDNLDSCELPPCCGNISSARTLLFKCQKDGGLIERDIRELRELLGNHGLPLPKKESINLNKILEQLGLSSLLD